MRYRRHGWYVRAVPLMLVALAYGRNEADAQRAQSTPPAGAATQERTGVEYFSAAALARVADSLARGSSTGRTLGTHHGYSYLQIRRGTSGVPEVHDGWTDVTMVQAGHGTLLTGRRVVGTYLESAGEHRGGTIVDGTSQAIATGDLLIIPAGIAHQYRVGRGDSLRYITVKVADK